MKNIKHLCLVICISSLFSCGNNCKQDYNFYNDYILGFYILDKTTKENLLEIGVNRYFRDTVEIYNENLEPLNIHPSQDGSFSFYFLKNTSHLDEPLQTPIEHTYYIYFEEGDYDTLNIRYQIGLDECSDRVLTQGSVTYNDSLYIDYPFNPRDDWGAFFVKKQP